MMDNIPAILSHSWTAWLSVAVFSICISILWQYWQNTGYSIPTYGGVMSFSRTLSLRRLGRTGLEESMRAYAESPLVFVPKMDGWCATAHSRFADEIARAPDDVLSLSDAIAEAHQTKYTFGPNFTFNHYHLLVIRNQLTRHLSGLFPDVFDEIKQAVSDYLGRDDNEWNTVTIAPFSKKVVARASNRIFVGLPLCRDEQWLALMISTAMQTVSVATFINRFPVILRPIVGWYSSTVTERLNAATKIGGPVIEKKIAENASSPSDDFVSWLISSAPEQERNPHDILSRILMTNFVAIHTSSMTVTNCLYWLLARPRYLEPLRQEIADVTSRLGWNKEAIGAMTKLDSFMKECMRITPFTTQGLSRRVRKPFTLSNGFQVPVGKSVSVHLYATHHDEAIYPNPDVFDGFRFVGPPADLEGEKESSGADTVNGFRAAVHITSKNFLSFGHGKHACPGRLFAAMEIKLVLAHLISSYEMKWPDEINDPSLPGYTEEGYRPPDLGNGHSLVPNQAAEMMIRKRVLA